MTTPASRLGRYEILERLGAGGMGEVWKAKDTRLGRVVALKVLKPAEADAEARRRLLREARIASKLTHPNICTLHDVGTDGETDYLVLELLEGETLRDALARGPLSGEELLRAAREVAAGLAHAHSLGFVHRDLKPSNVFLTPSGAKLLDFGLAREGGPPAGADPEGAETASLVTGPGVLLGTPGYMSPEQVRGDPAGPRSDVFSFGTLLYEMATAKRAFRGDTAVETLHAILKSEPPPLDAPGVAFPAGLRAVLERCLAKDPALRFASGAGLAEALGTLSVPPSVPVEERERPERRGLSMAVSAAGLLIAAAVGFFWHRSGSPPLDSLAVLPLANATGKEELAWVGDGLTESLIRTMAQIPNLRVMASSTVARFRGAAADPLAAGRELGVRAVLTGSVRGLDDRLGVSVSLVDARDGRHLWGETYERTGEKIPALEKEISGEIVRALRLRLSGAERRQMARAPTADREAYLLWLKGRYHLGKRTSADLAKALQLFRDALDRDPTYAEAWAGLAAAWDVFGYTGLKPSDEAFPRAKEAARKALEIDGANAAALAVLAHATWLADRDATGAETLFRKAIASDPASVDARHWYAHFLSQNGRTAESFEEGKKILELEPLSLVANLHLAEELDLQGRTDEAAAQLRKTIDLDPAFYQAWKVLGDLELKRGRRDEALSALHEAARLEPGSPLVKASLDLALAARTP